MALAHLDPPPPSVSTYWQAKMILTGREARFTVGYQFPDDTPANIEAKFNRIIQARRRLLPLGTQIEEAMFSNASVKGDGYPAIGAPIDPVLINVDIPPAGPTAEVTVEECNNPSVGLNFRFQASNGRWDSHIIRMVRDSWIQGNNANSAAIGVSYANTYAPLGPYVGGTAPDPTYTDGTDSAQELLHNYLSLVRDLTAMFRPDPDNPGQFLKYVWNFYTFSDISDRQTGVVAGIPRGRQRAWA